MRYLFNFILQVSILMKVTIFLENRTPRNTPYIYTCTITSVPRNLDVSDITRNKTTFPKFQLRMAIYNSNSESTSRNEYNDIAKEFFRYINIHAYHLFLSSRGTPNEVQKRGVQNINYCYYP